MDAYKRYGEPTKSLQLAEHQRSEWAQAIVFRCRSGSAPRHGNWKGLLCL